jgi:HD-GYP domain-containing protein (c-di-GMP phosphodiesterase class II)
MKSYNELLAEVKVLAATKDKAELAAKLNGFVENLTETVSSSYVSILISTGRSFGKEDYFLAHCLNVCVLSIMMGLKREYDKRRTKDLAFLALDHAKEYIGMPEDLIQWIETDSEMAEIVKLADIYDTMTHPPSYRHETTPSDTLMSILDAGGFFNNDLVKILLSELTLYPEGSWVELSSREIGKVVAVNPDMPLRPQVEIISGQNKKRDLSKEMIVYVVRALTENEARKAAEKMRPREE